MWKNKSSAKNLISVKCVYSVQGLNLDRFINSVKNRGIALYNIKKKSNKHLIVSVSLGDSQKFFAIGKELCYNIKKIGEKGKILPIIKLWRSVGIGLGAIVFCVCTFIYNDFIFDFSFSGSGSVYENEVLSYLNGVGIKTYTRFSSINLERLEDEILSSNKNLSYVSLSKNGNTLKIELSKANQEVDRLQGNVYSLYSNIDGQVEKIKVYRGTPLVKVGDTIKKGDLLVDGYMVIKEQSIKINVIASLSVVVTKEYIYQSEKDDEQDKAILFAQSNMDEKDIISTSVEKEKKENLYSYQVIVKYRHLICVG